MKRQYSISFIYILESSLGLSYLALFLYSLSTFIQSFKAFRHQKNMQNRHTDRPEMNPEVLLAGRLSATPHKYDFFFFFATNEVKSSFKLMGRTLTLVDPITSHLSEH